MWQQFGAFGCEVRTAGKMGSMYRSYSKIVRGSMFEDIALSLIAEGLEHNQMARDPVLCKQHERQCSGSRSAGMQTV